MNFTEKNRFIVKHTDEKSAALDMELLSKKNPRSPVLQERVNKFNIRKIDGKCLNALLDMGVTPEEILKNRAQDEKKSTKPANNTGNKGSKKANKKTSGAKSNKKAGAKNSKPGTGTKPAEDKTQTNQKPKVTKEQEFPNIKWDKTEDENVQLSILVYNDRVNCYKKGEKLQPELEKKPELAAQFQELMIRHDIADKELISFNEKGKWVGEHSLCSRLLNQKRFERMTIPEVTKELNSAKQNVSRYSSMLKNKKYKDEADRQRIEALVEKHSSKKAEIESYLEKVNDKK